MRNRLIQHVRRVQVSEPLAIADPDYADAFEIHLPEPDSASPASWVAAGLDNSPAVVEWVASLLGVQDKPATAADPLPGWHVVRSDPDVVHLERSLPLMRVVVVGRRIEPTGRRFTSSLRYQRPVLARIIWAVVGIGHRQMARRLLTCGLVPSPMSRDGDNQRAA